MTILKEYESLIRSYAERLLTQEQIQELVDQDVSIRELRKLLAYLSFEAFIKLYFPDEFFLSFAPIHDVMIADCQDIIDRARNNKRGVKVARAIPRGHSKSTMYARLLPLYTMLFHDSPLTVLIGATQTAANRLLRNMKASYNEALREDFGEPDWGIERIEYSDSEPHIGASVIVCFGIGSGAIRGMSNPTRPKLIVADDLDTDESVRSDINLMSNTDWWDKAVMSLGDSVRFTTSFVAVGTLIRNTSLLKHILDNPDFSSIVEQGIKRFADNATLWQDWQDWYIEQAKQGNQPKDPDSDSFYQQHKAELLHGAEVLWDRPDAYYNMMLYRLARGNKAFQSEIQNTPHEAGGRLGAIDYAKLPDDLHNWHLLAAYDSATKANDYNAWSEVLFNPRTKQMIVVYSYAKQCGYAEAVDDIARRVQSSTKRYDGIFVESNSAGAVIADLLESKLPGYIIERVHNSTKKEIRIDLLAEYQQRKQIAFVESINPLLVQQIQEFPHLKHDDAVDSLAMIVGYLHSKRYLELVPQSYFSTHYAER